MRAKIFLLILACACCFCRMQALTFESGELKMRMQSEISPMVVASGSDSNMSWEYTDDGTLTVRGTGCIELNFSDSNNQYSCVSGFKKLVVEEGITEIVTSNMPNNCQSLERVVLPNTLTLIGRNMFDGCSSLQDVVFGESVAIIGEYSFFNCDKLERMALPNSLREIGDYAFYMAGINEISLPEGVERVGKRAFCNTKINSLICPSSMKIIDDGAFAGCYSLENVTLNEGLTTIGADAFIDAALHSVKLPGTLRTIGKAAFAYCKDLLNVDIPTGIVRIEYGTFLCSGLESIHLPNTVKYIGPQAFASCLFLSLSNVNIPENCDSICSYAFSGATGAEVESKQNIHIPAKTSYIAPNAFTGNPWLDKVEVDNANENYYTKDGVLYSRLSNTLMLCPAGNNQKEIVIPDGITSIASDAFQNCKSVESVVMPQTLNGIGVTAFGNSPIRTITLPFGIKYIQPYTFEWCEFIERLTLLSAEPPKASKYAFNESLLAKCVVTVPKGCRDIYMNDSEWGKFKYIEECEMPPMGDINSDDAIDVTDINGIVSLILKQNNPILNKDRADVNSDDNVDILDLRDISRFILTDHFKAQIPEIVDLGLPSGTLWADRNVGGVEPSSLGGHFAWGETEEKKYYSWETYKWKVGDYETAGTEFIPTEELYTDNNFWGQDMPVTIYGFGAENDAAAKEFGADWRTPNQKQIVELLSFCTSELTFRNGVEGYTMTSPNGNDLFLPVADEAQGYNLYSQGHFQFYYMQNGDPRHPNPESSFEADCLINDPYGNGISAYGQHLKWEGISVRPVYVGGSRSKASRSNHKVEGLHINDFCIQDDETKNISIILSANDPITALQCDLILPRGLNLKDAKLNDQVEHVLRYQELGDGAIRLLSYSINGKAYNSTDVITLTVEANADILGSTETLELQDVILGTTGNRSVKMQSSANVTYSGTTGMSGMQTAETVHDVYDITGRVVMLGASKDADKHLPKGIYIINGNKVVVK